jgi:GNAT superfamily N-acetyltransferase
MNLEIREETPSALADYATIPIAYESWHVLDVGPDLATRVRKLDAPYRMDLDAFLGDAPTGWASRFDLRNWGFLGAFLDGRRVGGAAALYDSPDVRMLEGRRDLGLLWDIRVARDARGRGVGTALFHAAEAWALARGCRELKVETQNTNAPACSFYAQRGCRLRAARPGVYPEAPHEIQLLWFKDLVAPPPRA